MSPEKRQRLTLFALALLLHVGLFYLLFRLVIFQSPVETTDEASFQRIAVPARPVEPLQAPSASAPQMLNLITPPAAPAPVATIVTTASDTFSVAKVVSRTATPAMLPIPHMSDGSAVGVGNPAGGNGSGIGNSGVGNGRDLTGGGVGRTTRIAVIMDESGSMTAFDKVTKDYFASNFPNPDFYRAYNAIGDSMPRPANVPEPVDETTASITTDLYSFVYASLKNHPEAVVVITDFEDGYLQESTDALIDTLRQQHVKLIVISREMAAYPGLPEYCQESGGAYSMVQIDDQAKSISDVQPNPQLPPSAPSPHIFATMNALNYRYRFIPRPPKGTGLPYEAGPASEISRFLNDERVALENPYSQYRAITYDSNVQDHRDTIIRQVLLFCAQYPDAEDLTTTDYRGRTTPGFSGPNIKLIEDLTSNITNAIPSGGMYAASAAHVAQQIIYVTMQTRNATLARSLPNLLMVTAACRETIPTQARTNAEQIALTSNQFIDDWPVCPFAISSAITTAQTSNVPEVQEAVRYLKFALGDKTGLKECMAELAQAKNGPLAVRMLKHIEVPDPVVGSKVDYILQHQHNLVFKYATSSWQFRDSSAQPITSSSPTAALPVPAQAPQ